MFERFLQLIPKPWKQVLRRVLTRTLGERRSSQALTTFWGRYHVWGHFVKRRLRIFYRIRFFGWARYCPVCQSWLQLFQSFGVIPRPDARCPICGSLERHRLVWVFFKQQTNLFDTSPKRMLHIAPEREFVVNFRRITNLDYLTADLYSPNAMVKMDITDIQYPDNWFDVIYCSQVFEHVCGDRKAMREFNRVLKPNGWAVFLVAITAQSTFEDPSVTDPAERERLFGAHDHVRRYGPDFKNRLEQARFNVRCFTAAEIVGEKKIVYLGVKGETVFFCTKEPPALR